MSRGRLTPPNLDDRTWRDIVDEARALIPSYTPEWTDHNPSDPGMTLIELFGWMVEGMLYRLNRVPERNYLAFLNLLGITRDPGTPARTLLTYRSAPEAAPVVVPRGSQVSTQQTEKDAPVIFETDADLRVLPTNLIAALQLSGSQYSNVTTRLVSAPLSGLTLDIAYQQSTMLALGFERATSESISLQLRLPRPLKANEGQVKWFFSNSTNLPTSWIEVTPTSDGTNGFQQSGTVTLPAQSTWSQQNPSGWGGITPPSTGAVNQALFWVGIRLSNLLPNTAPDGGKLQVGLDHVLFNTVAATNALTITSPELLGISSGQPFQSFELRNAPLYKQSRANDAYSHVVVQVREPQVGGGLGAWQTWTAVQDFPADAGRYYRLDPVTGTIVFGNRSATASTGNGLIPPAKSEIQAQSYRYVAGGVAGNVPPGTLTVVRAAISGIVGVTNPGVATGGLDEEDLEQTKLRAPDLLRNRYRAVTTDDFEYLAREATPSVKRARALSSRLFTAYDTPRPPGVSVGDPWTYGGLNRSTGNVYVIIFPDAPISVARPMPSPELMQEVAEYLSERRTLTTNVTVTSPRYLPINVTGDVKVWQRAIDQKLVASEFAVRDAIHERIALFLHPLYGGLDGTGWQVGQEITIASLLEFIQPDPSIGFISSLSIAAGTPAYLPATRPFAGSGWSAWVQVADYEIVCHGLPTMIPARV